MEEMTKKLQEFVKARKHQKIVFEKRRRKYYTSRSGENWGYEGYSY